MTSLSPVLEAIQQWYTDDISGMVQTAFGGTSKASTAENERCSTSSNDFRLFRTAHMMDSGEDSCFKVPCCSSSDNDDTTNIQDDNQEQVINQQPLPENMGLRPGPQVSVESVAATTAEGSSETSQPKPSEHTSVSDDQQEEGSSLESNVVKEFDEDDQPNQDDLNKTPEQQAKRKPPMERQQAQDVPSSRSGSDTDRTVSSAGSKKQLMPPCKEEETEPPTDEKDNDDDEEPIVSSPLRKANAWFEIGDENSVLSTPHHADTFNSFTVEHQVEDESIVDFLDVLRDEFANTYNFGF